jgi:AraC-like DNA-binding protein
VDVTYRELRPPCGLESVVACLWQHDVVEGAGARVVPDGCVDLLWLGDHLLVAGPDTGPVVWESLPAVSGIRLRPGAAGPVLGLPASEIRDRLVPLADLWPEARTVTGTPLDGDGKRRWLTGAVLRHRADPDPLVRAAGHRLAVAGARVAGVAADLGVSERRLHRRTVAAVGYGPKTLARVIRLRRLIDQPGSLADRAAGAGYASQAHMSDEVRRLTGLSPVRFLEDARLTAA